MLSSKVGLYRIDRSAAEADMRRGGRRIVARTCFLDHSTVTDYAILEQRPAYDVAIFAITNFDGVDGIFLTNDIALRRAKPLLSDWHIE